MNENEKSIRKSFLKFTESQYIEFIGESDLVFSLIALVLLGIVIFTFEKISYTFDPFVIVFETIAAPIVVSLILFCLFNPVVNMTERYRISRVTGISIVHLVVVGVIMLIVSLLIPIIDS